MGKTFLYTVAVVIAMVIGAAIAGLIVHLNFPQMTLTKRQPTESLIKEVTYKLA